MTTIHSSASSAAALEHFNVKNSPAIQVGDLYFFSGMTAIDLKTFEVSEADLASQARMTLENFRSMLGDLGLSLDHVIKVNAQLSDVAEFSAWNEVFLDVLMPRTPVAPPSERHLLQGKSRSKLSRRW